MIGSRLKVNHDYAVSTMARKGVEDLYSIEARRWRIVAKGVERYAETGGEGQNGTYRMDGIRAVRINGDVSADVTAVGVEGTFKARDFLMPWAEYVAER